MFNLNLLTLILKGGFGSGNFGHKGRPGFKGGSSSKNNPSSDLLIGMFSKPYKPVPPDLPNISEQGSIVTRGNKGYVCSVETKKIMDNIEKLLTSKKVKLNSLEKKRQEKDDLLYDLTVMIKKAVKADNNPEKIEVLKRKRDKIEAELNKVESQITILKRDINSEFISLIKIRPDKKSKIIVKTDQQSFDLRKRISEANYFINDMVSTDTAFLDRLQVVEDSTSTLQRSRFLTGQGKIETSKDCDPGVIVHEIGHGIEQSNFANIIACRQFLNMRATSGLKKMSDITGNPDYREDEIGYDDNFTNKYAGKVYEGTVGTEIFSVGLEQLYNDPIKFYNNDPEYFSFMLDLNRGYKIINK